MPVVALPARPGIFLSERTAGVPPVNLGLVSRVYYIGSSTLGDSLTGVPTAIGSMDDFATLFGSSSAINLNSLTAYLQQTQVGLYFVKVKPVPIATVTIATMAAGDYTFTIQGVTKTVNIPANPTPTAKIVIDTITAAINNDASINQVVEAEINLDSQGANVYTPMTFRLRSKNGNTFTATAGTANLTIGTVAAPGSLAFWDYFTAADRLVAEQEASALGFIVCPEAFYTLTNQYERTNVGNKFESVARILGWMAYLDPGNPSTINHPIAAKIDSAGYNAVRGHSAYWYPYLIDTDGDDVSPATLAAAYAIQLYSTVGIAEPPAGTQYPFIGIGSTRFTLSNTQRDDLANSKVNVSIYKSGVGFVPFDTLTRSVDKNFKFINTRIILNCLERSIYNTIDTSNILFSKVGSKGVFFLQLRSVIESVLAQFYSAGALYGETPEQAYNVQCTADMQDVNDLEAGIVTAQIYCVPALTVRQINAVVFRVKVGGIQNALLLAA